MSSFERKLRRNGHRRAQEQAQAPGLALGDRVRLIGGPESHTRADGVVLHFTDYAVLGVVTGNGLQVVLLAAWDSELAQVWAFPAGKLGLAPDGSMWLGQYPSSIQIVSG